MDASLFTVSMFLSWMHIILSSFLCYRNEPDSASCLNYRTCGTHSLVSSQGLFATDAKTAHQVAKVSSKWHAAFLHEPLWVLLMWLRWPTPSIKKVTQSENRCACAGGLRMRTQLFRRCSHPRSSRVWSSVPAPYASRCSVPKV